MQVYSTFVNEVIILMAWQLFFWKKYVKNFCVTEKQMFELCLRKYVITSEFYLSR